MSVVILPDIQFRQSPNYSDRDGFEIEWVVSHYDMASDGRRNATWMCTPSAKRAPHFYIFRDGFIAQLVPLDKAAWHAGASEWWYKGEMTRNVNRFSIGVEIANLGFLYKSKAGRFYYEHTGTMYPYRDAPEPVFATLRYDNGHEVAGWWAPYTETQIAAFRELLGMLYDAGYPTQLVGHESIGMPLGRKTDPGPLFPWNEFSQYKTRTKAQILSS